GRRVHLWTDGAARTAHGARWRDHLRRQGDGGGKDGGARSGGRDAREESRGHGRHRREGVALMERTFAIVKPDAVAQRVAGRVISRIEESGFTIVAMKMLHMTTEQAAGFYAVHKERPFFASLCAFMTQGPSIVMV